MAERLSPGISCKKANDYLEVKMWRFTTTSLLPRHSLLQLFQPVHHDGDL